MQEAIKKTMDKTLILFNFKVIVIGLKILKAILNLKKTLWVRVKLCVANVEMAQYVHRMMPKDMIAPEIGSIIAGLARQLETTADSPLE